MFVLKASPIQASNQTLATLSAGLSGVNAFIREKGPRGYNEAATAAHEEISNQLGKMISRLAEIHQGTFGQDYPVVQDAAP